MKKTLFILAVITVLVVSGCHHDDTEDTTIPNYFCLTALEDGLKVSMEVRDKTRPNANPSLLYSINGTDWTPFVIDETIVTLPHTGDKMYMKANGTNTTFGSEINDDDDYACNWISFRFTKQVKAGGNIMYLLDGNHPDQAQMGDYAFNGLFVCDSLLMDASELLLPATSLSYMCYCEMFEGTSIRKAPALPATKLAESCYESMFITCKQLTQAPQLPATQLASRCYTGMFCECERLTAAPDLPATQLDSMCYQLMFLDCTSLTQAPQLPAKQLIGYCYSSMFRGCTSLTAAPDLPATTLAGNCYRKMFKDCTSLTTLTCMATDTSAENCLIGWMDNITTHGTFHAAPGTDWQGKIPPTWTVAY